MEDDNDELYDQVIDDEGNLVVKDEIKVSPYAQEYNEVISTMS